jgi:hypothetical protein
MLRLFGFFGICRSTIIRRRLVLIVGTVRVTVFGRIVCVMSHAFGAIQQALVRRGIEVRQRRYQRDDRPKCTVFMSTPPRRHSGHLDAVLRDPKQLSR